MSNDFSPSQASPDLAESYRLRLLDYREQHHKVRRLMSRVSVRPEVVLAADRVRNSIHQDLRRLAKDLGKSSADVDIDILSTADDLTEYQLPSFKLMQPWETLDSPRLSFVTNTDELHVQTQTPNSRTNEETIAQTEMFIPFGEQAAYHLFDRDQFFERSLQEPQRRRSAQKAQELLHGLGKYVEFSTQETFHRWVRFFWNRLLKRRA